MPIMPDRMVVIFFPFFLLRWPFSDQPEFLLRQPQSFPPVGLELANLNSAYKNWDDLELKILELLIEVRAMISDLRSSTPLFL